MSRVALDLGFIQIYWYTLAILLGILVSSFIAYREIRRQKIDEEFFINLVFYDVIIGIIGARLYYVLFNIDYYIKSPIEILEIWNGGLAIHGGLIAGGIFTIIYSKKNKVDPIKMIDILAVAVIVGQAIGRWGNFFNQEAYGSVVTRTFLESIKLPEFIINGMYINASYYHPTFLYESLWNILGFIVLLCIRQHKKYLKIGQLTGIYFIWYGIGRFFIEAMRTDSLMLGNIKIAQLVSIIMIIAGIILIIIKSRGSRFDNLYKEIKK